MEWWGTGMQNSDEDDSQISNEKVDTFGTGNTFVTGGHQQERRWQW